MRFGETRSGRDVCHQRYVKAGKNGHFACASIFPNLGPAASRSPPHRISIGCNCRCLLNLRYVCTWASQGQGRRSWIVWWRHSRKSNDASPMTKATSLMNPRLQGWGWPWVSFFVFFLVFLHFSLTIFSIDNLQFPRLLFALHLPLSTCVSFRTTPITICLRQRYSRVHEHSQPGKLPGFQLLTKTLACMWSAREQFLCGRNTNKLHYQ